MKIGVPKEIKSHENRVAITPSGVQALTKMGHEVFIEHHAGRASSFFNDAYIKSGAIILRTAKEVFETSEMIVKVKEPLDSEYKMISEGQIVFTYFHFASSMSLTKAMIENRSICIAYETITDKDNVLPLLRPMSEVAGRMATQQAAKFLEKPMLGKGKLLGGVPGVKPAKVLILGGGVVGTEAAKMASGLGAQVTLFDIDTNRLRELSEILDKNVTLIYSNETNIEAELPDCDVIIGAVLIQGAKAPRLISRKHLLLLQPGTVLVDVAVDQGGCFETTKPTTHENPTYVVDGALHYCVANMPGAVPFTSTLSLTNETLKYVAEIANKGWKVASNENRGIKDGLNIISGEVVHQGVSDAFKS